jgi:riboflavin kinase / FMN adenylyltransferase
MLTLHAITELSTLPGPVALAIGVFDGVHLGHQEVIHAAMDYTEKHGGTTVVMTFDPHPMKVLRPESAPRLLCSTRHKLHLLKGLGVKHTLLCPFDAEMAKTNAKDFVEALVEHSQPLGFISVGYTWSFGKGRGGDIHQLMELGQAHEFGVYGVPEVRLEGEVISSTLTREAVRARDFNKARGLLGRDYSVMGIIVKGKQLGRQLGFPTANVAVENEELPPNGVYAVQATLTGRDQILHGVANLGVKPTLGNEERSLEVYLLDFNEDIYGQEMEVSFLRWVRDERKFSGLDELKAQIARDVEAVRTA